MAGTSSRAATKCISEVPGLAKQTSTSAPTSVERRARAPFMRSLLTLLSARGQSARGLSLRRAEHPVGTQDPLGVEHFLYGAHQPQRGRVRQLQEVGHLLGAHPVLARHRTSGRRRRPEDLPGDRLALRHVGLEHGQVHVAVAHVPAAQDEGSVLGRQLGHPGQVVGDGGPGDDGVEDVVRAGGLGHEEKPLPGRDQFRTGMRGQHVDLDRPEIRQQRPQSFDVLVQPAGRRLLQDDDQVGLRRLLHLVGDAEVESRRSGDAAQHQGVGVLQDGRVDAAHHNPRYGVGHLGQGPERSEHGGRLGQPRVHLDRHLGRHGERPFGADEQLRQVVAGRALDELPARAHDRPVGQDDLEPQDVVARDAIPHGAHAARVGAHVPSDGGALLSGRHRVDQPQRRQLAVELLQGHPGLDHGDLVLHVDFDDPVHAVEGQQDAVSHRDGRARQAGATAPGHHRHLVLTGQAQDLGHFARRARPHQGERPHGRDGERLVVGVVGVHCFPVERVGLANGLSQLLQEFRHVRATPTSGRSGGSTLPAATARRRCPPPRRPAGAAARPRGPTPRWLRSAQPPSAAARWPARSARATDWVPSRPHPSSRRPTVRTSYTTVPPRNASAPRTGAGAPPRRRPSSGPTRSA